ncbi:tetratricopeptide repeat protein [Rugamonas sp.]|uniref:tetratricopeptide repeat protein n=1 Tax=Rugamonas sp. TaxID=1926287 RepID=UPI0025D2E113|nr:tetratricopeptide repeat protein [Rugamonas sp.]
MSLINKMLQDLDARGGVASGDEAVQQVRAVPERDRAVPPLLAAGGLAAAVVLAAGGWFGWRHLQQRAPDAPVAAAPMIQVVQSAPVVAVLPTPAPMPATQAVSVAAPQPQPGASPSSPSSAPPPVAAVEASPQLQAAGDAATAVEKPSAPTGAKAHHGHRKPHADATGSDLVLAHELLAKPSKKAHADSIRAAATPATVTSQGRELSLAQQSENAYRRALAALQEGRVNDAISGLDNALDLNPRNDGARQTLIGLLLENKRNDEAIHSLRLALAIDARQPPMAMLLARLQMEQGTAASATLLRSLPYAKDNAEYRAFLGTALQREQRNAEAAEQYQAALRMVPQNGVWWMGLGISLQADKRLLEAKEAYSHAKSSGSLNPELSAFVDRKLQQLPH